MTDSPTQGRVFDRARRLTAASGDRPAQVRAFRESLLTPAARTDVLGLGNSPSYVVPGSRLLAAATAHLETTKAADTSPDAAKRLADGLVLIGFVTPVKETTALEGGIDFDKETFRLVDPAVADPESKSVWSLQEGAIQAGELKRKKTSMWSRLTGTSTDVYVVANDKAKAVAIFDSDVALKALAVLDVSAATVEFDASLPNGIKLANATDTEVVGAPSKEKQDEWLNSFINAGATYREAFNVDLEKVKSFYELKDRDMAGKEVSMETYKGKVLLVVNVSSKCGLTPTNYPQLTALDEKYRDQGLQILAFPCNQFAGQEPGTHEEIMAFVQKYNCQFPFFEKHDVNGANARPVFTYLKAQLPGSFGNFVKWNFTKFLIDRQGKPFKRYAPKDLPFSFEDDIKQLLAQKAE